MLTRLTPVLVAFLAFSSFAFSQESEQFLDAKNRDEWRTHIQPDAKESAWKSIDWKPDLASGIADAAKSGKPILLWTMNGHPLGCT